MSGYTKSPQNWPASGQHTKTEKQLEVFRHQLLLKWGRGITKPGLEAKAFVSFGNSLSIISLHLSLLPSRRHTDISLPHAIPPNSRWKTNKACPRFNALPERKPSWVNDSLRICSPHHIEWNNCKTQEQISRHQSELAWIPSCAWCFLLDGSRSVCPTQNPRRGAGALFWKQAHVELRLTVGEHCSNRWAFTTFWKEIWSCFFLLLNIWPKA